MGLTRQQALQVGNEAVAYGTEAVWAAGDAKLVTSPSYEIASEPYNRPMGGGARIVPRRAAVIQRKSVKFTFGSELKGYSSAYTSAAVLPDYHAMLQGCGFAGAFDADHWTFTRETNPTKSVSVRMDDAGLKVLGTGCRGNCSIDFEPGKVVLPSWEFSGIYNSMVDSAVLALSYDTAAPPVCGAIGFDPLGSGYATDEWGQIRKVSLNLNNNVTMVPVFSADGYFVQILGHGSADAPGMTLTCEVYTPTSTDEWWAAWEDRTVYDTAGDLAITVGSEAGNIHKFQFGRLSVLNVAPLDADGARGHSVTFEVLGTELGTGNDDLVITAS